MSQTDRQQNGTKVIYITLELARRAAGVLYDHRLAVCMLCARQVARHVINHNAESDQLLKKKFSSALWLLIRDSIECSPTHRSL